MKACIIIPIYKPFRKLDVYELASLTQAYTLLTPYKIYLICSSQFDISEYENHALSYDVKAHIMRFPPKYFENIRGYNLLMLASRFYRVFLAYQYMLIYQTDAYVLKDELNEWCAAGVDYVGAPWIDEKAETSEPMLIEGGNGGFSLRNIKKHYRLSKHIEKLQLLERILRYSLLSRVLPIERILLNFWKLSFQPKKGFSISMLTKGFYAHNEDGNWSIHIALGSDDFVVAKPDIALKFSFEKQPEFLYEKNNRQLPFGCHAFQKYNWAFWSKHIPLSNL